MDQQPGNVPEDYVVHREGLLELGPDGQVNIDVSGGTHVLINLETNSFQLIKPKTMKNIGHKETKIVIDTCRTDQLNEFGASWDGRIGKPVLFTVSQVYAVNLKFARDGAYPPTTDHLRPRAARAALYTRTKNWFNVQDDATKQLCMHARALFRDTFEALDVKYLPAALQKYAGRIFFRKSDRLKLAGVIEHAFVPPLAQVLAADVGAAQQALAADAAPAPQAHGEEVPESQPQF